jgi:hypothetical protein
MPGAAGLGEIHGPEQTRCRPQPAVQDPVTSLIMRSQKESYSPNNQSQTCERIGGTIEQQLNLEFSVQGIDYKYIY